MPDAPQELGEIRPRVMGFEFEDDDIPRHWMAGAAVPTAMGNALHLIFPMGERFFVRSVRHFAAQLDDPALQAQVKGFYAQEGRHAHEHERVFALLERQGYDIRGFLGVYKKIAYGVIERISPPKLRLSVTVALEHYTAILAENALEHGILAQAHARMRPLLAWHACEEIEHKAVAFDVLRRVAPGYALRMAGMALATALLLGFWALGTTMLARQEEGLTLREALRQLRAARRADPILRTVFLRGIREYMRRDFHPWDNDNLALARRTLAELERVAA
jgi:hypothetical protein